MHSISSSFVPHPLHILSFFTLSFQLHICLAKSIAYETPYYDIFSGRLSLFVPNIFLSTLFWNAVILCPFLSVRVSRPCRTTGKVTNFHVLYNRREDEGSSHLLIYLPIYSPHPYPSHQSIHLFIYLCLSVYFSLFITYLSTHPHILTSIHSYR
jgi:hypothetical protein